MKKLSELSVKMTDEEYYSNDGSIHHSTLSKFASKGFDSIPTLFDEVKQSDSLLRGSIVDCILTDGIDTFTTKYYVANMPDIKPEFVNIVKGLFNIYGEEFSSLNEISNNIISTTLIDNNIYNNNWHPETRASKFREACSEYYNQLYQAKGKTLVSLDMYRDCLSMIEVLKHSPNTEFFYKEDNPFENVERVYQPIFVETIDGITYTIKPDELIVLHDKKLIIATDLKTTGDSEYKFASSFVYWQYSQQSRLYYRVLRQALNKDEYFKDYEITNWFFIVVNKDSLRPLIWEDTDTKTTGTLYYGKNNQIEIRDPFDLAKELTMYIENKPSVPIGINIDKPNDLKEWLNKL